jgi:phospholipid/cholesterol/gamma-HCH transport system substrate-binding protein
MVIFALSCIGILLYLWLSFGGAIPLSPKRYELKAAFPEATTLAQQADVRISGVTVGKVSQKALDKRGNATTVTLQIDPKYAPVAKDSRAILRQKSLLGETYVELTPGNRKLGTLKDGDSLARRQVEPTVELDEILKIFEPKTQAAFRQWVAEGAQNIKNGGGQDLNDALGNLGEFAQSGAGVLQVLDTQHTALRSVVRNTGIVFAALNQRYGQLHDLVLNSQATFSALAAEKEALARTFQIFPTFLDESRATLIRLQQFAINTHPLVNSLKPVADELGPTVSDLGALAPDLENLFRRLGPVIDASPRDLPEAARFLRGARPFLKSLHVFLPELNPIISFANYDQLALGGFIGDGAASFHYRLGTAPNGVPRYMFAFGGVINANSLGVHRQIPPFGRGTAYQLANALKRGKILGVVSESWTCNQDTRPPSQWPFPVDTPSVQLPPCFVQPATLWSHTRYPNIHKGEAPLVNSPTGPTPPALPPIPPG